MRRVGLVLGGGGGRGLAHAGVLRELEGMGVEPCAVVGVSMGATVAATYAMREDWQQALTEQDWSKIPVVAEPRGERPLEQLRAMARDARRLSGQLTRWSWDRGFEQHAKSMVVDLIGDDRRFDEARVPLAIGATDLLRGERAVLRRGQVGEALRASVTIPGLSAPVEIDGGVMIDGGFSDPAPVDVARALGAERVLAVDVGKPLPEVPVDEVEGVVGALVRGLEVTQRYFSLARFADADLVLRPDFPDVVRMLDFRQRHALVELGAEAVAARRDDVERLVAD